MTDLSIYLPPAPKVREWTDLVDAAELCANEIVTVPDKPTADTCAARAKEVHELLKDIEDARTAAIAPVLDIQRQINAQCKPLTDRLDAVKRRYVKLVADWQKAEEDERRRLAEAERLKSAALLEEAAKLESDGDIIGSEAALQRASDTAASARAREAVAPPKAGGGYGTISGRKAWVWRLVNLSAVPIEYLMLNESALNAAKRIKPRPPDIPGIEWTEERTGSVR